MIKLVIPPILIIILGKICFNDWFVWTGVIMVIVGTSISLGIQFYGMWWNNKHKTKRKHKK